MICFVCKQDILIFSALLVHYKKIHLLKSSSTFECNESNCSQAFPCLNSFKKHTILKHSINTINLPSQITTINNWNNHIDYGNNLDTPIIYRTQNLLEIDSSIDVHPSLPDHNNNYSLDLDNTIKSYHTSAVKFTMSLLNKNNFSKKDVFEIQREIEKNIIKPIENLITIFTQSTINEPILLSSFPTIITAITNTFNFFNTLNNWLVKNNLIQQFTITDEIRLVANLGETIYNNYITKGVLLFITIAFLI